MVTCRAGNGLLLALGIAAGCDGGPADGGPTDAGSADRVDARIDAAPDDDPSHELYAADRLPRFDLTLSPEALAALAAAPYAYVHADLSYRASEDAPAEVVLDVGVRLKGTTSFQPIDARPSFRIELDAWVEGQALRGLRRLSLHNATHDPSLIAERFAYRLFRAAGLPAPRANNALVHVNGELRGVYANVEVEDKTFLRRHFDDVSGNLYESDFVDIAPGMAASFELETNEDVDDRADLEALCAAAGEARDEALLADLAPHLDTDRFLRYVALEALTAQVDGYAFLLYGDDVPGNFRLYHDPTASRFVLLPWSMDRALKTQLGVWGGYARLPYRCLWAPACRAAYAAAVEDAVAVLESLPIDDELDAAHAQLAPWVALDPTGPGVAAFEASFAEVRAVLAGRAAAIRADLASPP